jgi:hypothetical protein
MNESCCGGAPTPVRDPRCAAALSPIFPLKQSLSPFQFKASARVVKAWQRWGGAPGSSALLTWRAARLEVRCSATTRLRCGGSRVWYHSCRRGAEDAFDSTVRGFISVLFSTDFLRCFTEICRTGFIPNVNTETMFHTCRVLQRNPLGSLLRVIRKRTLVKAAMQSSLLLH